MSTGVPRLLGSGPGAYYSIDILIIKRTGAMRIQKV